MIDHSVCRSLTRFVRSHGRDFRWVIIAGLLLPARLAAQGQDRAVLRVMVSAQDAPVADATIVVKSSSRDSLAARTDKDGSHSFVLPPALQGRLQVVVRKPGFKPDTTKVNAKLRDSIEVTVSLAPLVTVLAPVVSKGGHPDYFIDSTQMARSGRMLRDAFEVVTKLRPNMLGDKGRCPNEPVDNVWINGKSMVRFASFSPRGGVTKVIRQGGSSEHPLVDSILASIRAEHIAEIRYVNCWEARLRPKDAATVNAIFIVLKPGIDWDWARGSYADSTTKKPPS